MEPLPAVPEITPREFVLAVESGAPLQIMDVRNPVRAAAGHIDLLPGDRYHNLVGSQLREQTDVAAMGLDPALPTVTVCGHGNDSSACAAHLIALGHPARSMRGGMAAYMDLLIDRPIAPPPSLDALVQFDRIGKGSLAYLLISDHEALLVDPPRDAEAMLKAAREAGARVVGVADTHVHADYISGASVLAKTLGVPYHLNPADNAFPFDGTPGQLSITPLTDGMTIRVGRADIVARHNPGHTEGSTTLFLDDAIALSGDFIFVESLGRPDLAGRASEWAALLWDSLERSRRTWPREALVLPGHYSSPRERRADRAVAGLFGDLMRTNSALQMVDRDAFLAWATQTAPVPESYRSIKAINAGLLHVEEREATELEVGRNECAVARPAGAAS